jgi:hypothetical protein
MTTNRPPIPLSLNELSKAFPDVKLGLLEDILHYVRQHEADIADVIDARAALKDGDFLGVDESERIIDEILSAENKVQAMREALQLMDAYLFATAPDSNERQVVLEALQSSEYSAEGRATALNTSDKSATGDGESMGCEETGRAAVRSGEIPVVYEKKIIEIVEAALAGARYGDLTRSQTAKHIFDFLRSYFRTTEPVSLAVGAKAAKEAYESVDPDEHLIDADADRISKAVATAWRLNHVE